jgi:hypothetical protein
MAPPARPSSLPALDNMCTYYLRCDLWLAISVNFRAVCYCSSRGGLAGQGQRMHFKRGKPSGSSPCLVLYRSDQGMILIMVIAH